MNINVLIVDDEPHARRYLADLVRNQPQLTLIGECGSGREALAFCKNQTPDIIFLDIQMPGMTGVEVAQKLKDTSSLIIFSTAYDSYAIKAFELAVQDYLLKPFSEERFNDVLNRAIEQLQSNKKEAFTERMQVIFEHFEKGASEKIDHITIKDKGLEVRIDTNDIFYISVSSVYLIIHTKGKESLYRSSMNLIEKQLPKSFVRIHRSLIINTDHVISHKYLNDSTFNFEMIDGKTLRSSRSYKGAISQHFS